MELETKLRENLASQALLLSDNHLKPYMKDEFSFGTPSKGFLQDFQSLNRFHTKGSSSNPSFGVQTECYGSLINNFTYGCSTDFDDIHNYCKPFADSGGNGHVMDNFHSGGYLNIPQRNPPYDTMGTDQGYMIFTTWQDIKPINFVVPDEVSCITAENGYNKKVGMNKNIALPETMRAYRGPRKCNVAKGQWTTEEDRLLIELVQQYGVRKWSHIAQMLPGKIGKQCRERWHNHLRPDIKKDAWSEEEDKVLIHAHAEIGNRWAEIAKRLPGRTENSIKNHWNATKRRQYSKRKCRSKYPRASLLQEYIKSLNLDSNTAKNWRKPSASNATTTNDTTLKAPVLQPELSSDNLDYDFCFDENMCQEGCSIDSLLDANTPCAPVVDVKDFDGKMPCAPVFDDNDFDMDIPALDMSPVIECESKKGLDLVETISQVNEVKRSYFMKKP
ncbi:hypothetical protein F2P56_003490, partial [Juglans regia]